MEHRLEREATFVVPNHDDLDNATGVLVGLGLRPQPANVPVEVGSEYFDTPALALFGQGVSLTRLAHREQSLWKLKKLTQSTRGVAVRESVEWLVRDASVDSVDSATKELGPLVDWPDGLVCVLVVAQQRTYQGWQCLEATEAVTTSTDFVVAGAPGGLETRATFLEIDSTTAAAETLGNDADVAVLEMAARAIVEETTLSPVQSKFGHLMAVLGGEAGP